MVILSNKRGEGNESTLAEIKKAAKEANCSGIEIMTAMQGILASKGGEKNLEILCKIKRKYARV